MSVGADGRWFGTAPLAAAVAALRSAGVLSPVPGSGSGNGESGPSSTLLFYTGAPPQPASTFSLRAIDPDAFSVLLEEKETTSTTKRRTLLEQVESSKAFFALYEGAVWMHQGRTHLVKAVDVAGRVAVVRRAEVAYHTKTRDTTAVRLGTPQVESAGPLLSAFSGPASVTTRFFGFHRIWKASHRIFDTVDLFLPDVVLETAAAWVGVPPGVRSSILARLGGDPALLAPSLHAAAHALVRAAPAVLLCSPDDLGTECSSLCGGRGSGATSRLLAFDRAPGGAGGLAPRLAAALAGGLLRDAAAVIASCDCQDLGGCPRCVQSHTCGEHNACLDKKGAVVVLEEVGRGGGGGLS